VVSKVRSSGNGAPPRGNSFSRGALYVVLRNPLYIGEVRHHGVRHPGQHQPIVERELWDNVQKQLHDHAVRRRLTIRASRSKIVLAVPALWELLR
jgi:site-specific DNA recombinase